MIWMTREQTERSRTAGRSAHVPALSLFLSLVFVAAGAGCGGGGGEDGTPPDGGQDVGADGTDARTDTTPPDQKADLPDRVLEPEGLAVTNLAALGAGQGSLEYPVAVSTGTADDPTGEAPLPPEASAVGDFIEISAGRDVALTTGDPPLFLVLPVPGDVEASNLALAILTGGGQMAGGKLPPDARVWSVLSGMYDPDGGLFVVPLRFLMAKGTTVTLVENDDYDAPSLPGSSESGGSSGEGGLIDRGGDPVAAVRGAVDDAKSFLESGSKRDGFYVVCRGFEGDGCGDADKKKVREYLKSVRSDFSSGFDKPALRRTLPGRTVDGTKGRYFLYVLRPQGSERPCRDGDGLYEPLTRVAVTCHDPSSQDPPSEATTRMEYVHAIQYGYPFFDRTRSGNTGAAWLLEGPAAFAKSPESGSSKAVRWDRASGGGDLRKVDTALTAATVKSPFPAAGTQDFWVYLINSRNSSPKELLKPLWKEQIEGAPSVHDVAARYDLTAAHWGWVRNQAFEARVAGGNSDLNGTCVPDSNAWGSIQQTFSHSTSSSGSLSKQAELKGDWKAGVVKVEVDNEFGGKSVKATVAGVSTSGYLKAYPARSSSGKDCLYRNEGRSSTVISSVVPAGKTWETYVLLSNSARSSSKKRSYDIGASIQEPSSDQESPRVVIEQPPAVDYALKQNTLFLKANASDPGGGYVEPLEWTVEGSGGTSKTYRGDDLAIENFWSEGFQAGTFTIEVYAKDDDGQESTVSTQVEIEKK